MDYLKRHAKRVAIDSAGYFLIIAALATGWLPGPGGIPLAIAGLGLLSINNEWAQKIRDYLLERGGTFVKQLFPANPYVQWAYDALVVILLGVVAWLSYAHAAIWQISLAIVLFFAAVTIALLNRERLDRLKKRRSQA